MDRRWATTRYSAGGQNDAVLTRIIADSKVYWKVASAGTESGYFGQVISLPVNATGDIIIEASIRHKNNTDGYGGISVGVNQTPSNGIKYGTVLAAVLGTISIAGLNNLVVIPFVAHPNMTRLDLPGGDVVSTIRLVRKNGYLFIYNYGYYIGSYAYAATITTVDIFNRWWNAAIAAERWIDWIKVWPKEVVL